MEDGSSFQTLHVTQVQSDLLALYEKIACEKGRVEILHADGGCRCVLISKEELDSLEQAIEMLSDVDGVKALRECLAQVAAAAEPQAASVAD